VNFNRDFDDQGVSTEGRRQYTVDRGDDQSKFQSKFNKISHEISTVRTKFFNIYIIKSIVDAVDVVDAVAPVVDPV
jgi:hypothetical protein